MCKELHEALTMPVAPYPRRAGRIARNGEENQAAGSSSGHSIWSVKNSNIYKTWSHIWRDQHNDTSL